MSPRQGAPSNHPTGPRSPKEYEELVCGLIVANEEKNTLLAEATNRADMAQEEMLSYRSMLMYAVREADPELGGEESKGMTIDEMVRSLTDKTRKERAMKIKMEAELQEMRERLERFVLGEEKGKVLMTLEDSRSTSLPLSPENSRAVRRSRRAGESPKESIADQNRAWRFSTSPRSRKESLTISWDGSSDSRGGKATSPFQIPTVFPREGSWSSAARALLFPPSPRTSTLSASNRDSRTSPSS